MYQDVLDEMETALAGIKQALAMGHTEAVLRIVADMEWAIQKERDCEKQKISA